jgi:hypothetical protein
MGNAQAGEAEGLFCTKGVGHRICSLSFPLIGTWVRP